MSFTVKTPDAAPKKGTFKLVFEDTNKEYSWKIKRLTVRESLKMAKGESGSISNEMLEIIETAEPINGSPSLGEVVDMFPTESSEELLKAILETATSSTVGE